MMPNIRRISNTGVVVAAFVAEDTTMDDFSVCRRLGGGDTFSIYFNTSITLVATTSGKAAIPGSHIQHGIKGVAVLAG